MCFAEKKNLSNFNPQLTHMWTIKTLQSCCKLVNGPARLHLRPKLSHTGEPETETWPLLWCGHRAGPTSRKRCQSFRRPSSFWPSRCRERPVARWLDRWRLEWGYPPCWPTLRNSLWKSRGIAYLNIRRFCKNVRRYLHRWLVLLTGHGRNILF